MEGNGCCNVLLACVREAVGLMQLCQGCNGSATRADLRPCALQRCSRFPSPSHRPRPAHAPSPNAPPPPLARPPPHARNAVLQAWQIVLGVQVACKTWPAIANSTGWLDTEPSQSDLRGMRGTFFLGCILTFLGVMNLYNTALTITQKRLFVRRAATLRRTPSRAAIPPGAGGAASSAGGAAGSGK
jgi:hypothetical protein